MNRKALFLSALLGLALAGCNNVGGSEEVIARIGDETVYAEDLDLAVKLDPEGRPQVDRIASELFAKSAFVSKAVAEHPELESQWKAYSKSLETRLLTVVYQRFFATECLLFPESELRSYFELHKADFADSTGSVEFLDVRGKVAEALLLSRSAEALAAANNDTLLFLGEFKRRMIDSTSQAIREKFPVTVEKIVPPNPEGYYEAHKEEFKTAHAFEVYHVQMEDSTALAKLFKKPVTSLEKFKEIATKHSENKETAANGGYVGVVKDGFSFPYGIGMVNGLAAAFAGKPEGSISSVLATTRTPGRHVFYLVREIPPEVKPFDRVKGEVINQMKSFGYLDLDSDYVLVSRNGAPVVKERDILQILDEEPGIPKVNRTRSRLVSSLAECFSFAEEARALKLDQSWEYRAFVHQTRVNYITAHYSEMLEHESILPEDSLKAYFEKNGNPIHPQASFEKSKQDISDYLQFPQNVVKYEYFSNYEANKNRSWDDLRKQAFSNNIRRIRKDKIERMRAESWNSAKVTVMRKTLNIKSPTTDVAKMEQDADSLSNAHNYSAAIAMWKKVRDYNPNNDSLFAKATFQIAQLAAEAEQFAQAEMEYKVFLHMWPESPDVEKALFSRGFILNENLHRDTLALEVLEDFQKRFPNSELKESVDWLVDNIKSGGKLAEDLMKKIEAEP